MVTRIFAGACSHHPASPPSRNYTPGLFGCLVSSAFAIFFNTPLDLPASWLQPMGQYSVEDRASFCMRHWLRFMALMGDDYVNGPESQLHHLGQRPEVMQQISSTIGNHLAIVSELSHSIKRQFRDSLSESQLCAWEVIRDWWDGSYQDQVAVVRCHL